MFKSLILALIFSVAVNANIEKISDAVVKDLDGNDVSFAKYNGKCILVVNTASGCGFTNSNMKYFNTLKEKYPELVIVAFPSNSFSQEHLSNEELKDWFGKKWNVKYDYYAPIDAKESDFYKFLIAASHNKKVIWNYGKYLIEKDGKTGDIYGPQAGAILPSSLEGNIKKCLSS